jgi:hypothetical protein
VVHWLRPYNHWVSNISIGTKKEFQFSPSSFVQLSGFPQWYHNWTSNGCPHGVVSRARNHVMPKLNENAIKSWCFPWYQLNIKHHCWMVKVNGFIVFFLPPFWGDEPQWLTTHFWGVETTFICCIFFCDFEPPKMWWWCTLHDYPFCFFTTCSSIYTLSGSIIVYRYRYGIGIFACDNYAIYSSLSMELVPGVNTRRVSSALAACVFLTCDVGVSFFRVWRWSKTI